LLGTAEAVQKARDAIRRVLNPEKAPKKDLLDALEDTDEALESAKFLVRLPMASDRILRVFANNGVYVRQIEKELSVTIRQQPLEEGLLIIAGDSDEALQTAMSRVLVQSTKKIKPSSAPPPASSHHGSKHYPITTTVSVPKANHPMIIGKGGATINGLRAEFNVEIRLPPRDSASEAVQILGSDQQAVAAAAARVSQIGNSSVHPKSPAGSRPPGPSASKKTGAAPKASSTKPPSTKASAKAPSTKASAKAPSKAPAQ
jgi:polyribonucleotide nucleotidyltransferase